MQISEITSQVIATIKECPTFHDVLNVIVQPTLANQKSKYWSTAEFANNKRANKNYISTPNIFAIDIDGGLTIEDCQARLLQKGYTFAIAPTRNHRVAKDEVVADRFRVLFVLNTPIRCEKVFSATWNWVVESLLPEADKACKDPARGYYYSTSLFCVSDGLLLEPKQPPVSDVKLRAKETVKKFAALSTVSKTLEDHTLKFLRTGAGRGGRDYAVYLVAMDFKTCGFSYEDALAQILAAPIQYTEDHTPAKVEAKVHEMYFTRDSVRTKGERLTNTLKDFILDSLLLEDISGLKSPVLLNLKTKSRIPTTIGVVGKCLGEEGYYEYASTASTPVLHSYNPFTTEILSPDNKTGLNSYNIYEPADWQADNFYHSAPLPASAGQVPQLIQDFLMHLVDQDLDSYNYVIDWLAHGLVGRNLTVLATVGLPGIGKGTLSQIMKKLFGDSNFAEVRGVEIFKGRFNGQLANKRLVFIDEAHIVAVEEYNRFKVIVNDTMEIEAKGKDPVTVKNYGNYYAACNDTGSICLPKGDRRFSLINLTTTAIKDAEIRHHIGQDACNLLTDEIISDFACYLLSHDVTHNMYQPFRSSAKTAEVIEGGLRDWERYLVFEYIFDFVGKELAIEQVQHAAKENSDLRSSPGRARIKALCGKYPQYLTFVRRNNRHFIEVLGAPVESDDGVKVIMELPSASQVKAAFLGNDKGAA